MKKREKHENHELVLNCQEIEAGRSRIHALPARFTSETASEIEEVKGVDGIGQVNHGASAANKSGLIRLGTSRQ